MAQYLIDLDADLLADASLLDAHMDDGLHQYCANKAGKQNDPDLHSYLELMGSLQRKWSRVLGRYGSRDTRLDYAENLGDSQASCHWF